MKKRYRVSRQRGARKFNRQAKSTHFKNVLGKPMRGGIRL